MNRKQKVEELYQKAKTPYDKDIQCLTKEITDMEPLLIMYKERYKYYETNNIIPYEGDIDIKKAIRLIEHRIEQSKQRKTELEQKEREYQNGKRD